MKPVIRPAAKEDILRHFLYLLDQEAPEAAARFIEAVDRTIIKLAARPSIGAPKKFKNPRLAGLRRWPVDGFEAVGIYYISVKDILRVVRILHGKRDIDRIMDR